MDYSKDANTKKQKTKKATKKKVKNRVGIIIMRVVVITIILAFFAVLGAGMGAYLGILGGAPDLNLLQLEPNQYTSYICDQNGVEIEALFLQENRDYIKLSEMPPNIKNGTVAIEDERFYSHNGIDIKGMARALFVNIKTKLSGSGGTEGASTITQQLIKSAFFKDALIGKEEDNEKIVRKLQEQYMAIQLENQTIEKTGSKKAAKDQILELYLNTINYNGAYGVQTAAKRYFAKDVSELTLAECAVLVAIPQSPKKLNPIAYPEKNKERQTVVLNRMLTQGFITQSEYNQAIKEDVYSKIQTLAQDVAEESSSHSYYNDQIISEVIKQLGEQKGLSQVQASNFLFTSGSRIYSCQDPEIQKIVDESYKDPKLFPPKDYALEATYYISVEDKVTKLQKHYSPKIYVNNQEEADEFALTMKDKYVTEDVNFVLDRLEVTIQPQSAFIVTDYRTGEVKALIGGRGEKTGSRTFNRATQAKRQPGSTFKVLAAYAPGIDLGLFTPATVFNDAPYTKGSWSPGNWYSGYKGLNTVRSGIANSMNILAAKAIAQVGVKTSIDYLKNFGITTMVDVPELRADGQTYSDLNDTISLGGLTDGVILSELNSAYGTIANSGQYLKPIYYTKVVGRNGEIILENIPEPRTVLKETTAFLLTDMMEDVVTASIGTGKQAKFKNLKMSIAGKTGTTTDVKDLMFSGYTPYYVASVWLGHDQSENLKDNSYYHLLLWSDIMEKIHQSKNLEYKKFEQPEGIKQASVCNVSGKLPIDGLCNNEYYRGSRVITEYFASETIPTEKCDNHVRVRMDVTTNSLSNEFCPKDYVAELVLIKRTDNSDASIADAKNYAPTGICNVHNANSSVERESSTYETEDNRETEFVPPIPEIDDVPTTPSTLPDVSKSTSAETTTAGATESNEIPINNDKLTTPPTIDDFLLP